MSLPPSPNPSKTASPNNASTASKRPAASAPSNSEVRSNSSPPLSLSLPPTSAGPGAALLGCAEGTDGNGGKEAAPFLARRSCWSRQRFRSCLAAVTAVVSPAETDPTMLLLLMPLLAVIGRVDPAPGPKPNLIPVSLVSLGCCSFLTLPPNAPTNPDAAPSSAGAAAGAVDTPEAAGAPTGGDASFPLPPSMSTGCRILSNTPLGNHDPSEAPKEKEIMSAF